MRRTPRWLPLVLVILAAGCANGGEGEGEGADGLTSHILVLEEEMANLQDELRGVESALREAEEAHQASEEALEQAQEALTEAGREPVDDSEAERGQVEQGRAPDAPAAPRTPEGLAEQLHVWAADLVEDLAAPETGDWAPRDVPEGYDEAAGPAFDSPGELVLALAAERYASTLGLDWEVATRVLLGADETTAMGMILAWEFDDDAIAGRDIRLSMVRDDEGSWYVRTMEERIHCRRALDDESGGCR
jgi:hypothetical protein